MNKHAYFPIAVLSTLAVGMIAAAVMIVRQEENEVAAIVAGYVFEDCRADGVRPYACEIEAVQLAQSRGWSRAAASEAIRKIRLAELKKTTSH